MVFTLHRYFSCECFNNIATSVESTPSGKLRYNREFLLTFANFRSTKPVPDDICKYIESNVVLIRRRGRRGVQRRLRGNKDRLPLPSILLSNVRSINLNDKNTIFCELEAMCSNSRDKKILAY